MKYQDLIQLRENPTIMRYLRELIVQETGRKLTPYDVWIDLPEAPSFREPSNTVIKISHEETKTLDKIFRIEKWLISYAENKWRGHVFCPPHYQKEVYEASRRIFNEELGVEFNKFAKIFAKWDN